MERYYLRNSAPRLHARRSTSGSLSRNPAHRERHSFRQFLLLPLILSAAFFSKPQAATLPAGFSEAQFGGAGANLGSPTAMAFAPDGRLFVCQQTGSLRVFKNNALLATPFVTLSVDSSGERGLLGVAFDPNFAANQYVYVYYTTASAPIHNRVSRFTANGDVVQAGSETIILELDNLSATNHNGGALHFGLDGKLYIATGENAVPSHAQTLANLHGKLLRLNTDGTIPSDNPFFNVATGNNRAIWALGLRNPFTFNVQPGTGRIFLNDVGQGTSEEINDGLAGANYGWPSCEGPCNPPNANFRDPVNFYGRAGGACAIAGGTFYNPATVQFPVQYVGKYFFADLCAGFIRYLDPANPATALGFATGLSFPVDLQIGPDGALYYLQRGAGGQVWRITANQLGPLALKNAASYNNTEVAVASTVAAFGGKLATTLLSATTAPLPTTLAGVNVSVRDSANVDRAAGLYFIAPDRLNFQLPTGTAAGLATVRLGNAFGFFSGTITVAAVAPGLFSADSSGAGVMKGYAIRTVGATQTIEQVAQFNPVTCVWEPLPLAQPTNQVTLVLLGTGFRNRLALPVVTVGGTAVTVVSAAASTATIGFDELRLQLPALTSGLKDIAVTVDGKAANIVKVQIQ